MTKRPPSAIRMGAGSNWDLRDVHIANSPVGISADGPVGLTMKNSSFSNVGQAFDIPGGRADISGTRISQPATKGKSFVGYERAWGPPIPAHCSRCGLIFPSNNYNFGSSAFYGFDNEECCPGCMDEHAKVAVGLFDLSKKAIEIISAPAFSAEMIEALTRISEAYSVGKMSEREAADAICEASPELWAAMVTKIPRKALAAICGALLYLTAVGAGLATMDDWTRANVPSYEIWRQHIGEHFLEEEPNGQIESHSDGDAGSAPADEGSSPESVLELLRDNGRIKVSVHDHGSSLDAGSTERPRLRPPSIIE